VKDRVGRLVNQPAALNQASLRP